MEKSVLNKNNSTAILDELFDISIDDFMEKLFEVGERRNDNEVFEEFLDQADETCIIANRKMERRKFKTIDRSKAKAEKDFLKEQSKNAQLKKDMMENSVTWSRFFRSYLERLTSLFKRYIGKEPLNKAIIRRRVKVMSRIALETLYMQICPNDVSIKDFLETIYKEIFSSNIR